MKIREVFRFGMMMLRSLGVIVVFFGTSTLARGGEPAKGKREEDVWTATESHGPSGKSSTLEIIDGIVESGANRKSEIYGKIKRSGIFDGRIATEYLRKRLVVDPPKRNDRRMRVCLEILQCMPDPDSLPVLENLLDTKKYRVDLLRVIFHTMCLQEGGVARVETFLDSSDDKLRAAAIGALCCVYPDQKTQTLIQRIREEGKYSSGSPIGRAVGSAQSRLDTIHCYFYPDSRCFDWDSDSFAGRFRFVREVSPYAISRVPVPYKRTLRLGSDPARIFVWEQLQCLWNEDPQQARKILEEEIKKSSSSPDGGGTIPAQILEDLAVGTCPVFDPQKARCRP